MSKIPMVSQPPQINVKLFKHQLSSIYKMEKLETDNIIVKKDSIKHTKIGINADLSGYGKTLSMIGLIARDKMEWDVDIPYVFETVYSEGKGRIKNIYINRFDKLPTTLILVSNSIIGQWENELSKTTLITYSIRNNKDLEKIKAEQNDVVIVTPTHYNKLMMMYNKYAWKRFIFDEPGHLKVSGMRDIYSGFLWFVTATPDEILQQHKFLKNNFMRDILTNMFDPECFISDIVIKNNPDFIKASFEMPSVNYIFHQCFQPIYNVVENFVSPTVKLMVEAGNIEGAIDYLGGEKTSNIVELIKLKKQQEIRSIENKIEMYTARLDEDKVNQMIENKQRVLNQINDLDTKYNMMLKSDCTICAETLSMPVLEPNCQNLFCGKCLFKWLERKNSCPFCRVEIDHKQLVYIDNKETETDENQIIKNTKMTKIEKIIDIITQNKNGKFIVFSDYDSTFYPICDALEENQIEYVQVKGTIKNREKNLEAFRNGDTSVIFLNSTTDGSGINLSESTDIILCHKMDKSTEHQIVGRALRIGRTLPLNVHYLQIMK